MDSMVYASGSSLKMVRPAAYEKNVIEGTNGFAYNQHWRAMLCKVVGEVFARRVEDAMEAAHPHALGDLKSLLGQLWDDRCKFAHADIATNVAANVAAQKTFNAPSWTINQHKKLAAFLQKYEAAMISVMPAPLAPVAAPVPVPAPVLPAP